MSVNLTICIQFSGSLTLPEMFCFVLKERKMGNQEIKLSESKMAILLAMLTAVMPFSIDAYLPALPQISQALHADVHYVEKSLTAFIFGVALGQLFGGSLSDIKGRKNLVVSGLVIYMLSTLGLIFVQNVTQLLILRWVQAVGGGMASVVVGAIVRDNYEGKQAAQMFALIGIIMMAAPSLAPLLGSGLLKLGGWHLIFVFLLLYAIFVFSLIIYFLPKRKKAEALNKETLKAMLMGYRYILTTKPALGLLFFQAASFSSMMVFLTESPFVYMQKYGLSAQHYGMAFMCNIITMAIFNRITAWRLKRDSNPKDILLWGIIIQLAANSILAIVTWLSMPSIYFVILLVMISIGTQGLIMANTQALFMENFRREGGSANAVLLASQSLIGAGVSFLATHLHNGTIHIMASMMPACTIVGLVLLLIFSRHIFLRNRKNI